MPCVLAFGRTGAAASDITTERRGGSLAARGLFRTEGHLARNPVSVSDLGDGLPLCVLPGPEGGEIQRGGGVAGVRRGSLAGSAVTLSLIITL